MNIPLQKAVETVTIDDKEYQIDLSDERKQQHLDYRQQLLDVSEKAEKVDSDDTQALKDAMKEIKDTTQMVTDGLLGEGVFDELYEKTGHSTELVLDVIFEVIQYIDQRYNEKFQAKKQKYVKKK